MPDAVAGTFKSVLRSKRRECREPAVHGIDRQAVLGNSLRAAPSVRATMATVWVTVNGTTHAASWSQMRSPSPRSVSASIHPPVSGAPLDAAYAIGSCLSDAKHAPGLKNGSLLQRRTATFHARNIDPR